MIAVKARAHNTHGYGEYSPANSVGQTVETVPSKMNTPTKNSATSTIVAAIEFLPLTGTATGGDSLVIKIYHVQMYEDGVGWTDVQGKSGEESTLLTYSKTDATDGQTYRFRVAAVNDYGSGDFSDEFSVKAAAAAGQVPLVQVSILNTDAKIALTAAPSNNEDITAYSIVIETKAGAYECDLANCDGSDSDIISSTSCLVSMSVLRAAPFSLLLGDFIRAKVTATNPLGTGS